LIVAGTLLLNRDDRSAGLDTRISSLEGQLREIAARPLPAAGDPKAMEDVGSRLTKLETAFASARSAASDPALANRIAVLEGDLKALREMVSIVSRLSDEAATNAREARQRAEATAAALAELQKASGKPSVAQSDFEALLNRVNALDRGQSGLEAALAQRAAGDQDRAGRKALAATALQSAVTRGDPYAPELAVLKSLGVDARLLAPLEPFADSGAPSEAALARELGTLMPSLRANAAGTSQDGGFLNKLQANAEKLVRIRPLTEPAGGDPAAVLTRLELKAGQGDITGALAELNSLPSTIRAPAEAWMKKAQARIAAVEASRRLSADALSGLRQ
jgi:hypothetical protein